MSSTKGKVIQESGARSGRALGVPVRNLDVSLREEEAPKAPEEVNNSAHGGVSCLLNTLEKPALFFFLLRLPNPPSVG